MDQGGFGWKDEGATDHSALANEFDGGAIEGHDYYCPATVGGDCECSFDDQTNNNDYSQLKRKSKPKRKHTDGASLGMHGEANPYDCPYPASYGTQDHSSNDSYYSSFNAGSEDRSSYNSCAYCHGERNGPSSTCRHCNGHQNSAYCDYFEPSKSYGPSSSSSDYSLGHPKIQVTAKILFGTVSAISDLKQKKNAKKN